MNNIIVHFYNRNLSIALMLSVLIHLSMICTYYLNDEEVPPIIYIIPYNRIPQPSIGGKIAEAIPNIFSPSKPSRGIPVPVPDAEVNAEQTIPTQNELSHNTGSFDSLAGQGTELRVEEDAKIEDPQPTDFVPVEQLPVPVRQVWPEYPEIARRAGVEGTVWIKVLIDKEGRPKKALLVKSDADIFNESSMNAALQWVFTPALMNKGPVAVWVSVPFKFRLNK